MKKIVVFLLTVVLLFSCVACLCAAEAQPANPHITHLSPIAGGFRIHFTAAEGAHSYEVFSKAESTWNILGTTTDTAFDYTNLTDKKAYTFTVKGLDEEGNYLPDYDEEGFTQIYYKEPQLCTLKSTQNGLKLTWKSLPGITAYKVFVRSFDASWELLGVTNQNFFTDTAVTDGKRYTYTVEGATADGSASLTWHHETGLSATFFAAPKITGFQNLSNGTRITWSKCAAAKTYRVFLKTASGVKKLADTTGCTFTHKNLKNNTKYVYIIRALDKKGNFIGAYQTTDNSNTFFRMPQLTRAVSVYGGMKVSWKSVPGVKEYLLFVKTGTGWKEIGVSGTTHFTHKNVRSGKKYTYTVCCARNGSVVSERNAKGVKGTYIAAPEITGFEPLQNGVKIKIQKSDGAYAYRFFVKTAKGWKSIASTKHLSAVYKGVKHHGTYTFTIKALGKNGKYISACNPQGKTFRFFAPPAISTVTPAESGNLICWKSDNAVANYRIWRKVCGGTWKLLAQTDQTSWTDETVQPDTLYAYTVQYADEENHALSAYFTNTAYYRNGILANGKIAIGGKTLYFTNGFVLKGLVKCAGKYYYYNSTGFLQKNGIVGSKKGYYYADKNGVIDFTYRDAVKHKKTQWLVLNGKARKVRTEYDRTLYRAFVLLRECTNQSMTKQQKLYASFRHLQKITVEKNPRIPHYTGKNWHYLYANDIFLNRSGNCMSYGAAFAFMAKAIGYKEVYCCNSGGHGWAEVNHLVYDPEWDIHHKGSYYAYSYDNKNGPDYKGAIAAGTSWMRVKI